MVDSDSGSTSTGSNSSGPRSGQRIERGRAVRLAEDHDLGEMAVFLERQDGRGPVGGGEQHLGAAVLDHIGDLVRGQHDVDRVDNPARLGDRVVAHDPLDAVLGIEGHPVAGLDAERAEPARDPARLPVDLREGHRPPAEDQRGLAAEPRRRPAGDFTDRPDRHRGLSRCDVPARIMPSRSRGLKGGGGPRPSFRPTPDLIRGSGEILQPRCPLGTAPVDTTLGGPLPPRPFDTQLRRYSG